MKIHKIAIIGATGYTGSDLIRLLSNHPQVSIEIITSESRCGEKLSAVHPQFTNVCEQTLCKMSDIEKHEIDVVFLALPHGVSMNFMRDYGEKPYKIIDLSGDFRFDDKDVYEKWYDKKHIAAEYIEKSVYGMPELFAEQIKSAQLVANPGCYPTSAILALAPIVEQKITDEQIIVDSKSGVTGAGATAKATTHFPYVFGNFCAYKVASHRHTPEIEAILHKYTAQQVQALFTPHLLPIDRGILTTAYCKCEQEIQQQHLKQIFTDFYQNCPFVRIVDNPPNVKHVRGSNFIDIYATYDNRTRNIIVIAAIDNLVKGAAGQAIHNMNIMLGIEETTGLTHLPLSP